MKRTTYSSVLTHCAAALVAAGSLAGMAQAQETSAPQGTGFITQTDRLIVKYKDSEPNGKGPARATCSCVDRQRARRRNVLATI
jgi:serine protease